MFQSNKTITHEVKPVSKINLTRVNHWQSSTYYYRLATQLSTELYSILLIWVVPYRMKETAIRNLPILTLTTREGRMKR